MRSSCEGKKMINQKCERCGKQYTRAEDEIVVFPNICLKCDRILSSQGFKKLEANP